MAGYRYERTGGAGGEEYRSMDLFGCWEEKLMEDNELVKRIKTNV